MENEACAMRAFSTNDLNKQVGEVTDAASKAPILITRHSKPRFVMMSYEHYQHFQVQADPRRAYASGESPDHLAAMFGAEVDRIRNGGNEDGR